MPLPTIRAPMDATPVPAHCDVAVIGAGPAGSAAAWALARRGLHVVLVDQHAFPRDKVCGDGLIPDAHHALRKLGVRLGDLVRVMRSGRSSFAIVADVGPAGKLGEGSILLAERLGVPADPRGGGVRDGVRFELLLGSSSERPLSLTEIDSSAW